METEKGYYGIVIYIHISSDMIETPVSCIKKRPGVKAEPFFFYGISCGSHLSR